MKDKKGKKSETSEDLSTNLEAKSLVEAKHTSKIGVVDVPIQEEVAMYRKEFTKKDFILSRKSV